MAAMTSKVNFVGALAVHFSSEESVHQFFKVCLSSIARQTKKLDKICISWSAERALHDKIQFQFTLLPVELNHCVFLSHVGQLSQFQHYQRVEEHLCVELKYAKDSTWIMFGDGDDSWHTERVSFMVNEVDKGLHSSVGSTESLISTFVFNWKAVVEYDGSVTIEHTEEEYNTNFEYWMTMVRLDVFSEFFQQAHAFHLSSAWCDLAFDTFLLTKNIHYVPDPRSKNYLYLKCGNGSRGAGAAVTPRGVVCKMIEHEFMFNFPSLEITDITKWESYGGGQVFALKKPISVADLQAIKANPEQNEIMLSFIRPVCCNLKCTTIRNVEQKLQSCSQCISQHYCSKDCQIVHWKDHREVCRILKGQKLDIFSENYIPPVPDLALAKFMEMMAKQMK